MFGNGLPCQINAGGGYQHYCLASIHVINRESTFYCLANI